MVCQSRLLYLFMSKRVLFVLLLLANGVPDALRAQVQQGGAIHTDSLFGRQRPIEYPFLRESDIVWSTTLWKTIDLNEAFNQYMYFPLDQNDRSGKKSLAYVLWEAVERDEIPIYEDDDLKVPIDTRAFIERYTKADTVQLEIGYDEDDNELFQTVIVPKHFDGAEVFQYALVEAWFIGRQETRQDSRRLALAPLKDVYVTLKSTREDVYMGRAPLFWVPLQHPVVRALLARNKAWLFDNNLVDLPSWDYIFVNQVYNAFVTKEDNKRGIPIGSYTTGKDALREAAEIEQKVFEIGDEMWEY